MTLTADDYLAREDERRTELIDGIVVVHERRLLHQRACGKILIGLMRWTETPAGRGTVTLPLNVVLDDGNVLTPDVIWFDGELPLDSANAPRVPDLVVEVRSPGTWRYDIGRKRELYEAHGVRELWLGDTAARTMLIYRRAGAAFAHPLELGADQTLTSPLLPGLALPVGAVLPG